MTGGAQQVAAIEEQARVDVPRHAEKPAGTIGRRHDIGVEDAGEVVVARDAGGRQPLVERLERTEGAELGQPGVAELAEVGQGVAGEGGQELLVRRRPGQLLHPDLARPGGARERSRAARRPPRPRAPWPRNRAGLRGRVLPRPQPASEPASATEPQPMRRIALRRPRPTAGAPAPGITRPGRASRR